MKIIFLTLLCFNAFAHDFDEGTLFTFDKNSIPTKNIYHLKGMMKRRLENIHFGVDQNGKVQKKRVVFLTEDGVYRVVTFYFKSNAQMFLDRLTQGRLRIMDRLLDFGRRKCHALVKNPPEPPVNLDDYFHKLDVMGLKLVGAHVFPKRDQQDCWVSFPSAAHFELDNPERDQGVSVGKIHVDGEEVEVKGIHYSQYEQNRLFFTVGEHLQIILFDRFTHMKSFRENLEKGVFSTSSKNLIRHSYFFEWNDGWYGRYRKERKKFFRRYGIQKLDEFKKITKSSYPDKAKFEVSDITK